MDLQDVLMIVVAVVFGAVCIAELCRKEKRPVDVRGGLKVEWTRNPPTEKGWYWLKKPVAHVSYLIPGMLFPDYPDKTLSPHNLPGQEFAGPISEPVAPQQRKMF